MFHNKLAVEGANLHPLGLITDVVAGAFTGDWVSMAHSERASMLIYKGSAGTAGSDPSFTVLQASDNAGTGSKALALDTDRVHKKQAATNLASTPIFEGASADITSNVITNGTLAEEVALYVIDILPSDLDIANDFTHVSLTIADAGTGSAQYVAAFMLLAPLRYQGPVADAHDILA